MKNDQITILLYIYTVYTTTLTKEKPSTNFETELVRQYTSRLVPEAPTILLTDSLYELQNPRDTFLDSDLRF